MDSNTLLHGPKGLLMEMGGSKTSKASQMSLKPSEPFLLSKVGCLRATWQNHVGDKQTGAGGLFAPSPL